MPTYVKLRIPGQMMSRTVKLQHALGAYIKNGYWARHPDEEIDDTIFHDEMLGLNINTENYEVHPGDLFEDEEPDLHHRFTFLGIDPYTREVAKVSFIFNPSMEWTTLQNWVREEGCRLTARFISEHLMLIYDDVVGRPGDEQQWWAFANQDETKDFVRGRALLCAVGPEGEVLSVPGCFEPRPYMVHWKPDIEFDYLETQVDQDTGGFRQTLHFKLRGAPSRKPEKTDGDPGRNGDPELPRAGATQH